MRRITFALIGTTLLSSVSYAADPVADYVHDWSGFYVGVGGGGVWATDRASSGCGVVTDIRDQQEFSYASLCDAIDAGRVFEADINDGPNAGVSDVATLEFFETGSNREFLSFLGEEQSSDTAGWFGGAQMGWNHQRGRLVFGVEIGAYKVFNIKSSYSSNFDFFDNRPVDTDAVNEFGGSGEADFSSELDWLTKATLRIGTTFMQDNRGLAYLVGGGAAAHVSASANGSFGCPRHENCGASNRDEDFFQLGFVVGGGLEYALTERLSLSAEYNYVKLYGGEELRTDYVYRGRSFWSHEFDAGLDDLHLAVFKLNYSFN